MRPCKRCHPFRATFGSLPRLFPQTWIWHGCPKCYTRPKTNRAFWDKKREDNMDRDRHVTRQLRGREWKVIRNWQHSLKKYPAACLNRIRRANGLIS